MNRKNIAMIGCGKLGLPSAEMIAEHHNVTGYDIVPFESDSVRCAESVETAIQDADIIFVAVQTPHDPEYDGRAPTSHLPAKDFDYSVVKSVLQDIHAVKHNDALVVLISTVLPGTTRRELIQLLPDTRFVYNPFLIAMGTVKWDMVNPEMVMIGTEDGAETGDALELRQFYDTIMQNQPRYVIGTWEEIESTKIYYNTFISAKLGLVNMIQDTAERIGHMNAELVCDALASSTRRIMGPSYMKPGLGDSGACVLPEFNIVVNSEKVSIAEFYEKFEQEQTYLVKSAKYSMSGSDEKKVHEATCRDYDGEIIVFETASGRVLECTPEHLLPVQRDGKRMLIKADEVLETDKFYIV